MNINNVTGSMLMNPQLNYLIATHRSAELRRAAERARLTQEDRATEAAAGQRDGLSARTAIRLRLRGVGRARLRVRRA
jgi:hypothetical protein